MTRWMLLGVAIGASGCMLQDGRQQWADVWGQPEAPVYYDNEFSSARIAGEVGPYAAITNETYGRAYLPPGELYAEVIGYEQGFIMGVLMMSNVDVAALQVGDWFTGGDNDADSFPIGVYNPGGAEVQLQGCGSSTGEDWTEEDYSSESVDVTVVGRTDDTLRLRFDAVLNVTGQALEGEVEINLPD